MSMVLVEHNRTIKRASTRASVEHKNTTDREQSLFPVFLPQSNGTPAIMTAVAPPMPPLIPLLVERRSERYTDRFALRPRLLAYRQPDRIEDAAAKVAIAGKTMARAFTLSSSSSFVPSDASYLSPPPRGTLPEVVPTPPTPGRSPRAVPEDLKKRRKLEYNAMEDKKLGGADRKEAASGPRIPRLSSKDVAAHKLPQISSSKMTEAHRQRIEYMRRLASNKSSVALGSQQAANYGAVGAGRAKAAGRKRAGVVARCA
uniref:Uncharacterized protein n=1 Tax=Odontella aurita TaxID=265563 RepID=A0A7S4KCW0_9STRA